jgi:hypothetical protein
MHKIGAECWVRLLSGEGFSATQEHCPKMLSRYLPFAAVS